jgi:hypothetical protein
MRMVRQYCLCGAFSPRIPETVWNDPVLSMKCQEMTALSAQRYGVARPKSGFGPKLVMVYDGGGMGDGPCIMAQNLSCRWKDDAKQHRQRHQYMQGWDELRRMPTVALDSVPNRPASHANRDRARRGAHWARGRRGGAGEEPPLSAALIRPERTDCHHVTSSSGALPARLGVGPAKAYRPETSLLFV